MSLLLMVFGAVQAAPMYRCVDEKGKVHYSDSPPEDCEYTVLSESSPPTMEQRREAERIAEETKRLADMVAGTTDESAATRELRLPDESAATRELRLPDTVSSKYLRGKGTGWHVDIEKFDVTPTISFQVSAEVRRDGVYVEARFPNPGRGADFSHGAHAQRGDRLFLTGEPSVNYECGTPYFIQVRVYRSHRKLGAIDQLSQESILSSAVCELAGDAASSENP